MQGTDHRPWTGLGTLGWFLGVWVVMMAAMMFPSVAPTVALYSRMTRERSPLSPLLFTAVSRDVGRRRSARLLGRGGRRPFRGDVLAWDRAGRWVAGATLIVAAVYELTPLKDVCLGTCREHVLERRQLVDGRDDERRNRDPPPGPIPGEHVARETAAGRRGREGEHSGDAPRHEIAGREEERRKRRALPGHAGVQGDGRRDGREHHRGHHHDPRRRGTSRAFRGRSTARRPSRASGRPSTTSRRRRGRTGARRARAGHARPRTPGRARRPQGLRRRPGRSRDQAAQENSEVDRPVLPS